MRVPGRPGAEPLDVKMTPMIDVVFLLLLFFLWTSSFEEPEFDLPSALAEPPMGAAEAEITEPVEAEVFDEIVIRLRLQGGELVQTLNEQPITDRAELERRIGEILSLGVQPPVIVDPDPEVTMEHAVQAYDAARTAGADRVLFAANPDASSADGVPPRSTP